MTDRVRRAHTREEPPPRHLVPYITAWTAAGAVAVTVLALWHPGFHAHLPTVGALIALTALAEWASAELKAGTSGVTFSLLEAMAVINLVLLPPVTAALVTVGGVGLRHLLSQRPILKVVFNLGQHGVAASLGAALVGLTPTTPMLNTLRVLMTVFAAVVYGTVNTAAMAGIFRRLGSATITEELTERPLHTLAFTMRNAALGLSTVAIWTTNRTLALLLAGFTVALYLSHRPQFRFQSLFVVVSHERDQLTRVVEGVQEGIVLLDDHGEVLLWNAAMERMLGIGHADAVGRQAATLLTGPDLVGVPLRPADLDLRDDPDTDEQTEEQSTVTTVTLRAVDGTDVPVRMAHTLLRGKHGAITGDVLVINDLTREREVASLKEDFIARVSHELRTPLTPVRAYVQTLLRSGDRVDPATRAEVLEQVVERVGHMERLIDDLLLVSRVASGRARPTGEIDPSEVDMGPLVRRLTEWLAQGVAAGRPFELDIVGDEAVAWADPVRTGQILTNLVSNACKYGYETSPIGVRVSADADTVTVCVSDNGPGIPADKLDEIFEEFQRLEDPMTMRTTGLGVGLYLSRELATAMGGSLTVESVRGVGSTFVLTLPSRPGDVSATGMDTGTAGRPRVHRRPSVVGAGTPPA